MNPTDTAAWLIALTPIGWLVIVVAFSTVAGALTWTTIFAAALVVELGAVGLAEWDRRGLLVQGYDRTASPLFVLLSPFVYLAVRGTFVSRQNARGLRPFWGHVVAILGFVFLYFTVTLWGGAAIELSQVVVPGHN